MTGLSTWLGAGGWSAVADAGRAGGDAAASSEEMSIGEGSRAVLRFDAAPDVAGALKVLDAFTGREATCSGSSSRSEFESALSSSPCRVSLSSSSSLSSTIFEGAGFLLTGAAGFLDAPALLLSDSVVGTRGNCEGRCGLKAGALRFDAA